MASDSNSTSKTATKRGVLSRTLETIIPTCDKTISPILMALILVILALLSFVTMSLKSKHINIAIMFAMLLGTIYMLYVQLIGYNCALVQT